MFNCYDTHLAATAAAAVHGKAIKSDKKMYL